MVAIEPLPKTTVVGKLQVTVDIGEEGRSASCPSASGGGLDRFEVALQLPFRHDALEPAHLPLAGDDVVVDERIAQDLAGALALFEPGGRLLEGARQRFVIGAERRVALAGRRRVEL